MTKEAEIPVLHILHNQDIELYNAKVREDKIYLNNEKVAQFTNRGIFTIKDHRRKKSKKFRAIIYLDAKADTCKVGRDLKPEDAELEKLLFIPETKETIFEPLTDKDRKNVVKREIAKQLGKFKPMETWQFIVLIVLVATSIAIQFIF